MSLLTVLQEAAGRLLLPTFSSVIGSTDNNVILLKALLQEGGKKVRDSFPWPELVKEYTFTLATNTASYAYPADLNMLMMMTLWNRSQNWPLIGPVTGETWQQFKSGLITTLPRQRFRFKGFADTQFFIDPTPDSSVNTQTIAYEYLTKTWIRPKTWVASTSWLGIQYCFYNGNLYNRGSTGAATTGTSAPVHTSGTVSDGSISWTYYSSAYETFVNDSDEIILNNEMLIEEVVWRFKREKGFEYLELEKESTERIETMKTALMSASVVDSRESSAYPWLIGIWSYADGNYGV